jgi:alpha-aminoadipic semialdehyde synthase
VNVTICSELQSQTENLVSQRNNCNTVVLDVSNENSGQLEQLIDESNLVVSLLPYQLHPQIARKCIDLRRSMVTASYTSPEMWELNEQAKYAGITILNEVGLDPGIDHLLAMECFDQVKSKGGKVQSFLSFCGGLPAPEDADNALKYKFSWSPRGVLLNVLSSAKYLQANEEKFVEPGNLMDHTIDIDFLKGFNLEGYPNRDSLAYKSLYGIESAHTCLRGTLR